MAYIDMAERELGGRESSPLEWELKMSWDMARLWTG